MVIIIKDVIVLTLKEYKEKRMKDADFSDAYVELVSELNVIRAMIDARVSQNLTQKEFSERTGIAQIEIS